MRKLLFTYAALYAMSAFAGLPIPKDQNNTPMYTAQGRPHYVPPFTLTTNTYVDIYTLPTDTYSYNRIWKHIVIRNPDVNRTLYVCLGNSTSCTQDMILVPPLLGFALDDVTFSYQNNVTDIWMRLDSAGSVSPDVHLW